MGGYNYNLPDTSTRNKLMGVAGGLTPDFMPYYRMLQGEGQNALRQSFGAAQQDIGQQFNPAMRQAQSFLGGHNLLADSGYSNRLNRQLQAGAFGDLSNRYSQAAASQSQNQLSALERFISQRMGGQQDILAALMGSAQKKKTFGDYAGQAVGTGLGAWAGGGFKLPGGGGGTK